MNDSPQDSDRTGVKESAPADMVAGSAAPSPSLEHEPTLQEMLDAGAVHPLVRAALEAERDKGREAHERMLRVLAESDNQCKRLEREQKESVRFANEGLLRELLPVLDNLERCTVHVADGADAARELYEGVELTFAQFRQVVQSVGVEAVPAAPGVAFDPAIHEAVLQDDEADLPEKTVTRVVQPGFKYQERLLRPARVVVASGKGRKS
jgi:molecular chaperone GrpE